MAWHLVPGAHGSEAQALEVSTGTVPVERGDWLGRVDRQGTQGHSPPHTHPSQTLESERSRGLSNSGRGRREGQGLYKPGPNRLHTSAPRMGTSFRTPPRREIGPGMPGFGPGLLSRHPVSSAPLVAPLQCYFEAASVMLIVQEGRSQARDRKQKARTCLRPHSKLVLGLPFGSTLRPAPSQKDRPGGSSHCPLLRSCWGSGNSIHA